MAKKKVALKEDVKPAVKEEIKPSVKEDKKPDTKKHDKRKVIMMGVAINFVVYVLLSLFLVLIGVPYLIVSMIILVLIWGLFVMAYAYYNHK